MIQRDCQSRDGYKCVAFVSNDRKTWVQFRPICVERPSARTRNEKQRNAATCMNHFSFDVSSIHIEVAVTVVGTGRFRFRETTEIGFSSPIGTRETRTSDPRESVMLAYVDIWRALGRWCTCVLYLDRARIFLISAV